MAVGEIGLDYHYENHDREVQRSAFEEQLKLAAEVGLPVVIHTRDAWEDTMALLRKYRPKGVVHCFSGSAETAREIISLGMYIGFTGVVTFKNSKKAKNALSSIPHDRLLVETDCPYMAPEPNRGNAMTAEISFIRWVHLRSLWASPVTKRLRSRRRMRKDYWNMTERNDIMAGFHVAEATSTVSLNIALADALSQYPELFRENVKIASFFGSMPLIWNGGRMILGRFYPDRAKAVIDAYNQRGIPYRFTFTNPFITEEYLDDPDCNTALEIADNGMNEVIVFSPVLENTSGRPTPI